jgi:hypothetical protein
LTTAKDKVEVALDITALIKMTTFVIKESVVRAEEATMVKSYLVSCDLCSHRLVARQVWESSFSIVLKYSNI